MLSYTQWFEIYIIGTSFEYYSENELLKMYEEYLKGESCDY